MERTQISLTRDNRETLDAESARTGRSIAALIRAAVEQTYGHRKDAADDLRAITDALGAWNNRDVDGEAYVERVRSGSRLSDTAAR